MLGLPIIIVLTIVVVGAFFAATIWVGRKAKEDEKKNKDWLRPPSEQTWHPDPVINKEIQADMREAEEFNRKAGIKSSDTTSEMMEALTVQRMLEGSPSGHVQPHVPTPEPVQHHHVVPTEAPTHHETHHSPPDTSHHNHSSSSYDHSSSTSHSDHSSSHSGHSSGGFDGGSGFDSGGGHHHH